MEDNLFYSETPTSAISLENEYYYFSNSNSPTRAEVNDSGYADDRRYGTNSFSAPNRNWLEDKAVNRISPSLLRASTLHSKVPSVGRSQRIFANRKENIPPNNSPSPISRQRSRRQVNKPLKGFKGYDALEPPKLRIKPSASDLIFRRNQYDARQIPSTEGGENEELFRTSQFTPDEAASRTSGSKDLALEGLMLQGIDQANVPPNIRRPILSTNDRFCSLARYNQDPDYVFQDNTSPLALPTITLRAGDPSFGIRKRRHSSASLPDSKRTRSPTKTPARSFQSPKRAMKQRSEPRLANLTHFKEEDVDDYLYDADNSSLDEKCERDMIFPGDSPYRGGIRRQEPVDRRFTTSPRTLIRIFENAKEVTRRVREEAALLYDRRRSSVPQEIYLGDFHVPQPLHSQLTADTIRQPRSQPQDYPSVPDNGNRHDHIKSYGCASSRTKPPENQRPRANSGCHSSATVSERGFLGGHKLIRRFQGFSDSDSGRDRRFQQLNLPKSRESLPNAVPGEIEENEGTELVEVGPSGSTPHQPSGDDNVIHEPHPEHSATQVLPDVVETRGVAVGCDIEARGEALDSEEHNNPEPSGGRISRSENAGRVGARAVERNSESTAVEPLTPVEDDPVPTA